jgi:membrane protein
MAPPPVVTLLRSSFKGFFNDQATVLAAAICYNTLFALTPLLLVVLAVVGTVFDSTTAHDQILNRIGEAIGPEGQRLADTLLRNAAKNGLMGSGLGIAMVLIGATSLFNQIKFSLNQVWNVTPYKGVFWRTIRTRLLSFLLVLVIAALLILMLAVSTALAALGNTINRNLTVPPWVFHAIDLLLSIGVITVMFALVYKWLPDAQIDWRESWVGAAITSVLFAAGKVGLGLYLGHATSFGVYGAAGSLVIVLVWVYYSAAIFLFGAELTQCHAEMYGKEIVPAPWARHNRPAFKIEERQETPWQRPRVA